MKRLFSNKYLAFSLATFYFTLFSFYLPAQEQGYHIEVQIENFEGDTVILGFRRAEKVYSKDTIGINADGKFVFKGEEELPPGNYLVLLPPDNKFFDFVLMRGDQHFSTSTTAPDFFKNQKFKGSEENMLLYDYQAFMNDQIQLSKKIDEQLADSVAVTKAKKKKLEKQKKDVAEGVKAYQENILKKHPNTYVAKLIAAFKEVELPEDLKNAETEEGKKKAFQYYKDHYWDGFDLTDDTFVNSPYLKQKVDRYVDDLTMQKADSVIAAVNLILDRAAQNQEVFRFILPHLLNKYHKPKIMGLDKVYVHISDKYYKSGKADWVSEEVLKRITDDAYMIKGVLLGKQAPNVKVQLYDPAKEEFTTNLISPYDIKAEFTIIFLWKPGCGHCKAMTKELIPFYEKWKPKGIEIFSITSANHMDLKKAIKDIKEKEMPWIITADPYSRARALQHYYGVSLPKIYVLDKNKKIIANRVGVPQLEKIIEEHQVEAVDGGR